MAGVPFTCEKCKPKALEIIADTRALERCKEQLRAILREINNGTPAAANAGQSKPK